MLIQGTTSLEGVAGEGVCQDPAEGKSRTEDRIDIGVIRLADAGPSGLDGHYLSPSAINIEEPPSTAHTYLAIGYPITRVRVNPEARSFKVKFVQYAGVRAPQASYDARGVHHSTHVALEFEQEHTATEAGIGRVASPRGMSGGGVWWWHNADERLALPSAKLTATIIEHHPGASALLATRVRYHIALIRRRWIDLRPFLVGFPSP